MVSRALCFPKLKKLNLSPYGKRWQEEESDEGQVDVDPSFLFFQMARNKKVPRKSRVKVGSRKRSSGSWEVGELAGL